MSRGLGEMQIIALFAFEAHERALAAAENHAGAVAGCLMSHTDGGFIPIRHLRFHAWSEWPKHDRIAQYRGTPGEMRENYPNSFKRALDRLVLAGYAEFRHYDRPDHWRELYWRNQYRLTEKGLSVRGKISNTYPRERLTIEHSARLVAEREVESDRRMAELGIPRLSRWEGR
jgi:hypothetical protein